MCKLEGITSKQWLTYTLANIREQNFNKINDLLIDNYKAKMTEERVEFT
jgi:hypothetical protein